MQELLGHADVSTTMNIYAHATREAKRTSARRQFPICSFLALRRIAASVSQKSTVRTFFRLVAPKKEEYELFSQEDGDAPAVPTLTHEQFRALEDFLKKKENPALLPIQIAYYTGLRIGEVCALTWQDVNLDEQYLTVPPARLPSWAGCRPHNRPGLSP